MLWVLLELLDPLLEVFPTDDPLLSKQGLHRGEPMLVVAGFQVMDPTHAFSPMAQLVEVIEALAQGRNRDRERILLPLFVEDGLVLLRGHRTCPLHSAHIVYIIHPVPPLLRARSLPPSPSRYRPGSSLPLLPGQGRAR